MTDRRSPVARRILQRRIRPVRRHLLLHRRRWAAVMLMAAVLAGVSAVRPPAAPTATVVVAAADLPGGSVLDRRDLLELQMPADLAPAYAARRVGPLLDRRLAVGVRAGEMIGSHRLAGSEQRRAAPGLTTVPVRIADGALLLRPGDVIDLVAADSQGEGRTIARALPVISAAVDEASGSFDGAAPGSGSLVLLGVPPVFVADVVAASAAGYLLFTFSP